MSNSAKTSNTSSSSSLGTAIREARTALGLSLRQLAEAVNVHYSFLARLESGDYQTAKPAILQRLSRTLERHQALALEKLGELV